MNFKKLKGKHGLVMILRTGGKWRIQIVKDVWRSKEKSLDPDVCEGYLGLEQ